VLKAEQARLGNDIRSAQEGLATVDANLADWQEILETAMRFATNCAKAYARASSQTRRRFNQAVFKRIEVRDGKIAGYSCHEPFDVLFSRSEFEYGDLVEVSGLEPPTSTLRTWLLRPFDQDHSKELPGERLTFDSRCLMLHPLSAR